MRDAKTQAILDDAAAVVARSSVATPADKAFMDAIADRDRNPAENDKPFDFMSLFIGDDKFSTFDELLTD